MRELLLNPSKTLLGLRIQNCVYYLLLMIALCAFWTFTSPWTLIGGLSFILLIAGNVRRRKAMGTKPDFHCPVRLEAQLHTLGALICLFGGPILVGAGGKYMIMGALVLTAGMALQATHHSCRFSTGCRARNVI